MTRLGWCETHCALDACMINIVTKPNTHTENSGPVFVVFAIRFLGEMINAKQCECVCVCVCVCACHCQMNCMLNLLQPSGKKGRIFYCFIGHTCSKIYQSYFNVSAASRNFIPYRLLALSIKHVLINILLTFRP